jgi:hypothetical protein
MEVPMIQAKTNEVPMLTYTGWWLWCWDPSDGWEGYIHMDCDMICDADGFCCGCGAPSPAATRGRNDTVDPLSSNVNRIAGREH